MTQFKSLLEKFLSDDSNSAGRENPGQGDGNDQQSLKRGLKGLSSGLNKILTKAEVMEKKVFNLSTSKVSPSENITLMQYVAENGLADFLPILLDEGLDPNYPKKLEENDNEGLLPPVLLAAKNGHSEIIKKFKQHNYNINASASLIVIDESDLQASRLTKWKQVA